MSITISLFEQRYQDQVIQLITDIQQKEFGIKITIEDQPDLKAIPDVYQKRNGNFWVCLFNDTVVGTVSLLDIGNGDVALKKMFVKKEWRGAGQGVSRQLIGKAFEWAKEKELKRIFLGTTSAFLAAHKFYEKNGFAEIRKEELPPNFSVMGVDSKFYVKYL